MINSHFVLICFLLYFRSSCRPMCAYVLSMGQMEIVWQEAYSYVTAEPLFKKIKIHSNGVRRLFFIFRWNSKYTLDTQTQINHLVVSWMWNTPKKTPQNFHFYQSNFMQNTNPIPEQNDSHILQLVKQIYRNNKTRRI